MEEKNKTLFRGKNLMKASEPEQLDGYLKVTGFGPWVVLITAALVLAAVFVWTFFGRLQTVVTGAGYCKDGELLCYVVQSEIEEITKDSVAEISGLRGSVTDVDPALHNPNQVPNDVRFLLPDSKWYCTVKLRCPLEDGLYTVNFYPKSVSPASFITRGD